MILNICLRSTLIVIPLILIYGCVPGFFTELFVPKQELFKKPLIEKIEELDNGDIHLFQFKIKYAGRYSVFFYFNPARYFIGHPEEWLEWEHFHLNYI